MASTSPARLAAFKILLAVECRQSHSDDLLRGKAVSSLSAQDRNLTTALVLGTLRWQIQLDEQFRPLMKRPLARLDPEVLVALRMGAFQLLHLDRIPARAAIDESVELTKLAGHLYASGMVNAVLRKLSDGTPSSELLGENSGDLAASLAHPRWLVERWTELYGCEATQAICEHGQTPPSLAVRFSAPEVEEELAHRHVDLDPSGLLREAWTVAHGDVTATKAFRKGRLRAQDEGSQLVGEIAARAGLNPPSGAAKILDLCAAPGGKTLILAERLPKARIIACEASAERLARLQRRLSAFDDRIECQLGDATALKAESTFDLVLADVPCSGTGTLGRNPEIRHRLKLDDLPRQAERQRKILAAALRAVRPGGRVVYSTCSLEPEENEQLVAAVLGETANARELSLESTIDVMTREGVLVASAASKLQSCITPEGALRLLPDVFRTDGFFVALLEKSG